MASFKRMIVDVVVFVHIDEGLFLHGLLVVRDVKQGLLPIFAPLPYYQIIFVC